MRRKIACLFLLCWRGLGAGCVKRKTIWSLQNSPGCPVSTSDPQLDRERTYLASLLALQERKYAILRTQAPSAIEATYTSGNNPSVAHVHWLIGIGPDASLTVDVAEADRQMHRRVAGWYDTLLASVNQLKCRDPNWLRWEAQNRGLVPIGAFAGVESAGAEAPMDQAGTAAAPLPVPVQLHPGAERLRELEAERAELHFVRSLVWAGIGAGIAGLGLTYTLYGAMFLIEGCQEDGFYGDTDCTLRDVGRIMVPVGASRGALGGTMLGILLPRGLTRLKRLATNPGGALAVEARYNRAVLLVRLGHRQAAREALAPFASGTFGNFRRADANVLLRRLE